MEVKPLVWSETRIKRTSRDENLDAVATMQPLAPICSLTPGSATARRVGCAAPCR
jgi:hypothetical protein